MTGHSWLCRRLLTPRAPDAKRAAVPCRMAMAALERALVQALDQTPGPHPALTLALAPTLAPSATSQPQLLGQGDEGRWPGLAGQGGAGGGGELGGGWEGQGQGQGQGGAAEWSGAAEAQDEADGLCVYHMFKVYREAAWLFARHDATSRFSEWPSLHADLKQLAAAATPHARLRVFERLMRNYKVFQR
ncbi:hypothetical protein QJQ45_022398 [Haematococcus lacustris]|nr:hypothetical protein QJQ45_022398 [Haematococcus lacustris]